MSGKDPQAEAVEELEQFGLREYEAKCFVSLTKITSGTAREVSEHVDVPRTRVYEAVRSLESDGLVEIQHSSPQQFRAVTLAEALEVLDRRHQDRIERLERSLTRLRRQSDSSGQTPDSEIWSLSGSETITARAKRLIEEADSEVLLLIGDERAVAEEITDRLHSATDRGVDAIVGAGTASIRSEVADTAADLSVYESEFEWLSRADHSDGISVGRLLLIDDERLLASTITHAADDVQERAICGNGTGNGLVVVLRGLLSQQFPG